MSGKRSPTRGSPDVPRSESTTVSSDETTSLIRESSSAQSKNHPSGYETYRRGVRRSSPPVASVPVVRGPRTPRTVFKSPPRRPATSLTLRVPVPSRVASASDWGSPVRPEREVVALCMSEVTSLMPA